MSDTPHLVARIALTLAVIASPFWFASVAGAGVTNFSLSPASGPAGTTVSVNGSGCSPGPFAPADYVRVAISTVPSTSAQVAVAANGTWQGTLTIPANAASAPAVVTATCITDDPVSLLTIYLPRTFTVTSAPPTTPPTTAPPTTAPTTTAPATTPTTGPGGPATTHRTTTTVGNSRDTTPGSPNPATTPSPSGADPKGPTLGDDGTGGTNDPGTAKRPGSPRAGSHRASTQSRTADLDAPTLSVTDGSRGSTSLEWLFWVVLLASLAAAGVVGWWYRSTRRADTAEEGQ